MRDRTLLWALLGTAGVGIAYALRKEASSVTHAIGSAMDAVQAELFKLVIPSVAQPYADVILRVAREETISPFLITQMGYRESLWGNSTYLDKPGPGGRGDGGHGHGLMQIDDRSWGNWLSKNRWDDPYTNVSFAIGTILKNKINFFAGISRVPNLADGTWVTLSESQAAKRNVDPGDYPEPRPLHGDELTQAGVAAFNTGEGNVLMSLAVGLHPDFTTTPPPYATDVLGRMATLIAKFNDRAAVS
jgi:hypothetical protein